MVKPIQKAEVKNFTGGMIPDGPLLEFPPNATRSELNFNINFDGSRNRRLGFDREVGGDFINANPSWASLDYSWVNSFMWHAPGGDTKMKILVIQLAASLYMFDARAGVTSLNVIRFFERDWVFGNRALFGMANVQGTLVVVKGDRRYVTYTYNPETRDIVETTGLTFKIRDVFGLEEVEEPKYETYPYHRGILGRDHYYNLYNQGWGLPRLPWEYGDKTLKDPVKLVLGDQLSPAPSNSDVVWQGMDYRTIGRETIIDPPPAEGEQPKEENKSFIYTTAECFHKKLYEGVAAGSVPAARGFFIIDAFDRGASRKKAWDDHVASYPMTGNIVYPMVFPKTDSTGSGPTCVAEYAGRAFFSGIHNGSVQGGDKRSPNYSNYVFFGQLTKNWSEFGNCYQEGDPTSREGSDVVDTDGGFVKISGAVGIKKLVPLGKRLLVMATNGVWAIRGGGDGEFTATNFMVEKICNFGLFAPNSVVVDGKSLYYWGVDAIYRLSHNQFGDLEAADLTTQTMKSYYGGLIGVHLYRCHGSIDLYRNKIHWIFSRGTDPGPADRLVTDLEYDISLGAFFPKEFSRNPEIVMNPVVAGSFVTPDIDYMIQTPSGQPVGGYAVPHTVKYFGVINATSPVKLFFGEYQHHDFRDFKSVDTVGYDAPAHIYTGEQTAGDVSSDKQIAYLTTVFKNKEINPTSPTEPFESSCIGRIQWDFADRAHSNRWGNPVQLVRKKRYNFTDSTEPEDFRDGFSVIMSKTKLRGHGRAFGMRLDTEPGKDCHIVGWNLTLTGNGVP